MATATLLAGRALFCEKPLTASLEDAVLDRPLDIKVLLLKGGARTPVTYSSQSAKTREDTRKAAVYAVHSCVLVDVLPAR
jgi:hypothetical protein